MAHFASLIAKSGGQFLEPASSGVNDLRAELNAALERIAALEARVDAMTVIGNAVTPVTKKARTGNAMTAAEKQRAYRARLKAGKKEQTNA